MKYTPWKTDKSKSFYVLGNDGSFICNARDGKTADFIALAPEMYETLMEIADWWAGGDCPPELWGKLTGIIAKVEPNP